jgi:hypothetical protein
MSGCIRPRARTNEHGALDRYHPVRFGRRRRLHRLSARPESADHVDVRGHPGLHQHRAPHRAGRDRLRLYAAVIPQEIIAGWLGPNSGWLGVATAVVARRGDAGRPGGRPFHWRRSVERRRRSAAGARCLRSSGCYCGKSPSCPPVSCSFGLRFPSRSHSWPPPSPWRSASHRAA